MSKVHDGGNKYRVGKNKDSEQKEQRDLVREQEKVVKKRKK